MTYMIVELFL